MRSSSKSKWKGRGEKIRYSPGKRRGREKEALGRERNEQKEQEMKCTKAEGHKLYLETRMKNELPQPDLFVLQEDEHIDHLTSQAFFPFFLQIYFIKIGKVLSVNKKILFILRPSIRLPYRYIYLFAVSFNNEREYIQNGLGFIASDQEGDRWGWMDRIIKWATWMLKSFPVNLLISSFPRLIFLKKSFFPVSRET